MTTSAPERHALRAAFFELATRFRSTMVLFAGLELDVFAHIPDAGASPEEVAAALDVDALPVRLLLNALAALGLLSQQAGRFRVPPDYAPILRGGPNSFGHFLLAHKCELKNWLRLAATIRREDSGLLFRDLLLSGPVAAQFVEFMEEGNQADSERMLDVLRLSIPSLQAVLDIGGGQGYVGARLLELNPTVRVTLLDLDEAIERCRARFRDHPHRDRVEFVSRDALTMDYEDVFDLVMLNNTLHFFSRDEKREVLRRAVRAIRPGCRVAVMKTRLDPDGIEPAFTSVFSLRMYAITRKAYHETDAETVALLEEAGTSELQTVRLSEGRALITGIRR